MENQSGQTVMLNGQSRMQDSSWVIVYVPVIMIRQYNTLFLIFHFSIGQNEIFICCWVMRIKRITPQKIGTIRPLNSERQVYIHELIALNKANFWALAHFKVICSVALTIVLSKQADGDGKEHTTNSSLIDGYNLGISCIKYYYIEDHC